MNAPDALLVKAVRAIAASCDGASTEDGIGFSGTDTHFGRALALVPSEAWSPQASREAWEMLGKYRGQLSTLGISFEDIAPPPIPETHSGKRAVRVIDLDPEAGIFIRVPYGDPSDPKNTLSARWDARNKRWLIPLRTHDRIVDVSSTFDIPISAAARATLEEPIPEIPLGSIDVDDQRLTISFDYDPIAVGAVKEIPGRAWEASRKIWTAPLTSIRSVRAFARTHRLTLSPEAEALPDCDPQNRPLIEIAGGEFILRFDFDRDIVARVRDLPGARWSRANRVWRVDLEATIEVAEFAISTEAIIGQSASQILSAAQEALDRIEASAAADADIEIPNLGGDLLPFQRAGVAYVLRALGYQQTETGIWGP